MSGLVFGIDNLPQHNGYVVTQGTFDGVHKGHVHVLQQVVRIAQQENLPSILITFHPHPRLIVNPNDKSLSLLSSIKEKAKRILDLGIDTVLVLPFTEEIASLNPEEFISSILVNKLKVKHMVVGYDHRFGKNRSGGFQELIQFAPHFGFQVSEISPKEIDEIAVSSTRIRKALQNGNLKEANELLGYNYTLTGTVIHGQKRGRTIGFPTANLNIDEPGKLIPNHGVYAGFARLLNAPSSITLDSETNNLNPNSNDTIYTENQSLNPNSTDTLISENQSLNPNSNDTPITENQSLNPNSNDTLITEKDKLLPMVLNLGVRPTVDGTQFAIEAHLLDFSGNLYDHEIQLELIEFIRPEKKFESFEELKNQIQMDTLKAREILQSYYHYSPA